MKQISFYLAFASILTSGMLYLNSCTADYEEPDQVNLDINAHIMRSKRLLPEISEGNPSYIPVRKDECALYALTAIKKESYQWTSQKTASEYYEELSRYAERELNYKGGEMKPSDMLQVGIHFNLISGEQTFGNEEGEAKEYFESNNVKNIKIVNFSNHTAKFLFYDKEKQMVVYTDANNKNIARPVSEVVSVFYK